jgi:hypothetical protein
MHKQLRVAVLTGVVLALTACLGELDDDSHRNSLTGAAPAPPSPSPSAQNAPPTIAGSPMSHVLEGEPYEFVPTASDADGDTLSFSIARKPAWASFDPGSGRLWGTPTDKDVGNFTNIGISVSDGEATASLTRFDISVDQIALGSATISWEPPTQNADGSPLTDLTGYRIYYGRNRNALGRSVVLNNAGLSRYVIENLTPAIWHFTMTSVNAEGVESNRTPLVSKTIG